VKELLVSIQDAIQTRVSATTAARPDWPCRAGCDHCCRHLASVPEFTGAEWDLLSEGIAALATDVSQSIQERMRALKSASYPFTCPLLDLSSGRCLTYAHRPLACRTYGFYVDRDEGLYCGQIRSLADAGLLDEIVWGSQAGVEAKTAPLGAKRSLLEWLGDSSGG
jgi:uncharacterized protein